MNWHTIDGGGGFSAGGSFSLDGTIGQPDPGVACGGQYVMESGFWYGGGVCPPPPPTPTTTPPVGTATRTSTRTQIVTATPTATPTEYIVVISTGTIVPGTNDIGNHCDRCVTDVRVPFAVRLYDQSFSGVEVGSNGTLGFRVNNNPDANACLRNPDFDFAILPFWDDLTTAGSNGEGVYTSVSGDAPSRILNIEWRAQRVGRGPVNFEVRLFERTNSFEIIYGNMSGLGRMGTVGAQRDTGSQFTQVQCGIPGAQDIPLGSIDEGVRLIFSVLDAGPTPTPCPVQFSDVPPGHTFYPYVRCLACRGVVSGYEDGTFRPNANVTRGQISKIVSNAIGLNDDPGTQLFEDVPPGSTFYAFIQRLAIRGYMGGYPCGGAGEPCGPGGRPYFRPGNAATRGQVSKIVSNSANFAEPVAGQTFQDVPVSGTFYEWVGRLASRGIVSGYPCGAPGEPCVPPENRPYFRPGNSVTRGQSAKIVANTYFPGCSAP